MELTREQLQKILEEFGQDLMVKLNAVKPGSKCTCGAAENSDEADSDLGTMVRQGFTELGETLTKALAPEEEPEAKPKTKAEKQGAAAEAAIDEERKTRVALAKYGYLLPEEFDATADDLTESGIVQAALGDRYVDEDNDMRNHVRLDLLIEEGKADAKEKAEAKPKTKKIATNVPLGVAGTVKKAESPTTHMPKGGWRRPVGERDLINTMRR